jgi:hypothetical protein
MEWSVILPFHRSGDTDSPRGRSPERTTFRTCILARGDDVLADDDDEQKNQLEEGVGQRGDAWCVNRP